MPVSPRSTPELQVLIVGCGAIAGGYDEGPGYPQAVLSHAGAYSLHDGFRIAACVEPDEARRTAFMARWNIPDGHAELEAALAAGRYDVASLCSPDGAHAPQLEALAGRGLKAVFCEKPMALGLQGNSLAGLYRRAGTLLAVNYTRRFVPEIRRVGDEIAAGAWGALQSATGQYGKGIRHNGCHLVDLAQMLLGPLELASILGGRLDHGEDDPSADLLLRSRNGAPVVLLGSDSRRFALFELRLTFEGGQILIEDSGFRLALRRARPDPRFPAYHTLGEPVTAATELSRSLFHAAGNLYDAVTKGVPLMSSSDNAIAAEALCEEARVKALRLGKGMRV
jgi:predicted dehydrogenase